MFDRIEEDNLYMEDNNILPIIIKYSERDVEIHNKHKDMQFDEFVNLLSGIHDVIVINRGVNEKTNSNEFEVVIENGNLSVKLRIDSENNFFFFPKFSNKIVFIPEGENELLKTKAKIVFTKNVGISFWRENGFLDCVSEISDFIERCLNLSVPFDDSQLGEQNKKAWEVYAEGMSMLNKEKKTLLPIKSVSKPHKTKSKAGELITVIDVILALDSRQNIFQKSLTSLLKSRVESKFKINFTSQDYCCVDFDSYHSFSDDFVDKLCDLAEEHCFSFDDGVRYSVKGSISLKQDNDFDEILNKLENQIREYTDDFRRVGSHFISYSDDTAYYIERLIEQSYGEFLSIGSKKPIIGSFQNTNEDYSKETKNLIEMGVPESDIRITKGSLTIKSIAKPLFNQESICNQLKFEKCTIRYKVSVGSFDSNLQIDGLECVSVPNRGGYYEGIVLSLSHLKEKSLNWQKQLRDHFGDKFRGQDFLYSYRKLINVDALKKLQRDVFFENEFIKISATRANVTISPVDKNSYNSLINQIRESLPPDIILVAPPYTIEKEVKLVYEEEEACKRMFNKIRNGINSIDSFIQLRFDGVDYTTRFFEFSFQSKEERNEKIESVYAAFEQFKNVCTVHFESQDGFTHLCFSRDSKLESDFQDSFRAFNNEAVKVIERKRYDRTQNSPALSRMQHSIDRLQNKIDDISEDIDHYERGHSERRRLGKEKYSIIGEKKELINEFYELQRQINNEAREILYTSPTIGDCYQRTYDCITIKLPKGFDSKIYGEKPILKPGEYLYFPMAGSSSETARQKIALDRIEGKKNAKDNPPVNEKLSDFLFNPRYARPAEEEEISLAERWIKEYGISKNQLNDKQIESVAKACSADDIAFIQGPPGTGKTTVIAEIIWKEIHNNSNCRILLTSQNNLAVDNALERLHNARGLRPVRILNTKDKEDADTKDGSQYMLEVIFDWEMNPTSQNSDNAVAHWMDSVREDAISNQEYAKYADAIQSWVSCLESKDEYARGMFVDSYKSNVNLFAATCSYCASKGFSDTYKLLYGKDKIAFDVIIMDEASKATVPEMAVPMVNGKKIIMIGDHRQLPPILSPEHEKAFQAMGYKDLFEESYETLKTSHFGVLFKAAQKYVPSIVTTLTTQYRMHEQIMNTINQFYKRDVVGGLQCGIKETQDLPEFNHPGSRYHGLSFDRILSPDDHAIWINVETPETYLNPGYKNLGEVEAIEYVIRMLTQADGYKEYLAAQNKEEDKEIGLITFYSGQRKAIMGKKLPDINRYKISAVDKFQGMERNIVIVSTVRSNNSRDIGFARESERINVAFSRAKKLLIVVGNKTLFSKFEDYRESINNMKTIDFRTLKDLLK